MKMKAKTKRIVLIVLTCLFCAVIAIFGASCSSCKKKTKVSVYDAEGTLVFDADHTSITLEVGTTYALPTNVQVKGNKATLDSLKLLDAEENEIKLTYGAYQFMTVGEYTAKYAVTYDEKSYEADFTIVCEDTTLPEIKVVTHKAFGYLDETAELPKCTYADLAGIDQESLLITVLSPSGKTVEVEENKFLLDELGEYVITIEVKDNNGNLSKRELKLTCYAPFVDENRAENVIYSFNDEEYLSLAVDVETDLEITREIVSEGYPAIESEAEGNGVLKISSDALFGDERDGYGVRNILTQFNLHEELAASTGYNIVARIAVSKDTDYVKLFRRMTNYGYASEDKDVVSQMYGLKANTWYDWEIDPIYFGYHVSFENFVICFRDSGNTALYIDEIYFTPKKFVDTQKAENVVADFDEEGYLHNVFQNVYCDPTTTRADRVNGSEFSIVSSELPAANGAAAKAPNLAASGSALKVQTTANGGGMTYMFPEAIQLDEITRLKFRMYLDVEAKYLSTMVIGFFNGEGFDGGNNYWTYAGTHYETKEWFELDFETEHLYRYTAGNSISGFYIYLKSNAGWNTPLAHTFYLDEINLTFKNSVSEQTDSVLASFDTSESLANVTQNGKYRGSEFVYSDGIFHKNGVLMVRPNVTNDGFTYYFDNTVLVKETDSIYVNMARASEKVEGISFYAINSAQKQFLITQASFGQTTAQMYQTFVLSCDKILASITDGKIIGIAVSVRINEKATDAFVAVDEITYYDATKDNDNPEVGAYTQQTLSALEGNGVDLRVLPIPVTDESDKAAYWQVQSLRTAGGQSITLTDGYIFTPTAGGAYSLGVQAIDHAGNTSDVKTLTFTIDYYPLSQKKEYYLRELSFDSISSVSLVSGIEVSQVSDSDCAGGKGVQGSFARDDKALGKLTIDLGGVYTVGEIEKVVIRYKVVSGPAQSANMWYRLHVNNETDDNKRLKPVFSFANTSMAMPTSGFETITINRTAFTAAAGQGPELAETDTLNSLYFWYSNWQGSDGSKMTLIIDSVEITEKYVFNTTDLEFNSAASLNLIEEGYNTELVDLGNGNKALQATICQWWDGHARNNLKINVGGQYKVSEIESLEISYKVSAVENPSSGLYWNIHLNAPGGYSSVNYADRVTGIGTTTFEETSEFRTITITSTGSTCSMTANTAGGTLLSADDYLENVYFRVDGDSSERVATIQIDYIKINLKTSN